MPNDSATRDVPRPRSRNIVPSLFGMFLLNFILLYALSDIPGEIGRWKMAAAEKQLHQGEFEQAIATADDAISWDPDNVRFLQTRINWLQGHGDAEEAKAAIDQLLAEADDDRNVAAQLLFQRAGLLQSMGQHAQAVADANKAFEYANVTRKPSDDGTYDPEVLNGRAYIIARAAAASQVSDEELGKAYEDMRELVRFWHVNLDSFVEETGSLGPSLNFQYNELMFLDTFAYVRLYAGEPQDALRDFNRCLAMCDHLTALAKNNARNLGEGETMRRRVRQLKETRAVVLHHRGEAYRQLGNSAAANADFFAARRLGYDPKSGVW